MMPKWEHKAIKWPSNELIEEMGLNGWEVASEDDCNWVRFKRQLPEPPQHFEYKVLEKPLYGVSAEKLNEMDVDGWQLLSTYAKEYNVVYVFRRPITIDNGQDRVKKLGFTAIISENLTASGTHEIVATDDPDVDMAICGTTGTQYQIRNGNYGNWEKYHNDGICQRLSEIQAENEKKKLELRKAAELEQQKPQAQVIQGQLQNVQNGEAVIELTAGDKRTSFYVEMDF